MKKIGVLGLILTIMTMLKGCISTTYTLQFDNINKVNIVNRVTGKEVSLTKEQITTVKKDLGKIIFKEENDDLGDKYLYKVSMSSGDGEKAVEIFIYDSTHMKKENKSYTTTENVFDIVFYKALFQ